MQSVLQRVPGTPTTLKAIPSGRAGVRATLRVMSKIVRESRGEYEIIQKARSLVSHLPPKAWEAEARAIFFFVRDRIRYVLDPVGLETVATPLETLKVKQGDCDDKAVLAASLLQAIGHPAQFVAVGYARQPISHVFVRTLIGQDWLPMELTEPNFKFGDYPDLPRITSWVVETVDMGVR